VVSTEKKTWTLVTLVGLAACVGLGIIYLRTGQTVVSEITARDNPVLQALHAGGQIDSSNQAFQGLDEVCIVNDIDISKPNCRTSGQTLALIKGNTCELISLEKLGTRVLWSENTFECRQFNEAFSIVISKSGSYEILGFN
jgi:hypothetical protein